MSLSPLFDLIEVVDSETISEFNGFRECFMRCLLGFKPPAK